MVGVQQLWYLTPIYLKAMLAVYSLTFNQFHIILIGFNILTFCYNLYDTTCQKIKQNKCKTVKNANQRCRYVAETIFTLLMQYRLQLINPLSSFGCVFNHALQREWRREKKDQGNKARQQNILFVHQDVTTKIITWNLNLFI